MRSSVIKTNSLLKKLFEYTAALNHQFGTLKLLFTSIPLSRSVQNASFAFITSERDGERYYLLQWNDKWQRFNFIGGKVDAAKGDDNDFRQALSREIAEEIGICSLEDVIVEHEIKRIKLSQYSRREKKIKKYQFALFEIHLFPALSINPAIIKQALKWLSSHHENVYVTRQEVNNLQTVDGKPISKTVYRILKAIGEI